ncbi:dTDP-4-dehydrorhamnose reductase [Duganella sp. Leaf126]|uniref:family 1 glycosylhydrolase n=1 Tax=Duganella sp. Leaf126 TaxID=1736266 RepID=UPI0006F8C91F|nr:family 1 glycosylhydrolase [Duganella sp. Leaf126]KQQ40066.1 dTDP-4-dehydrorhamnose reductase [Duganella sp. Leaf126]
MQIFQNNSVTPPLALWGGVECTVNRVGDRYFDQAAQSGHGARPGEVELLHSTGLSALRYPILWERIAPDGLESADWSVADAQLAACRERGITVIAGLVHHGSGPRTTSLVDAGFAPGLAAYAGAVAARYPWIDHYTPVNEPLTTARFSTLYGLWYPHASSDHAFVTAVLNQTRATVLAMQAVRSVNPAAKLVQTDDLGKTWGTDEMAAVTEFYNDRRWLAWDLLCGKVDQDHRLWAYLLQHGATAADVLWFRDHRCPPDIIGVNYYVTSERWLDHRVERYPHLRPGLIDGKPCIDTEAARVAEAPETQLAPLLIEAWHRYGLPIAITEAHIHAGREDQLRWMTEIWEAALAARAEGADVQAVTAWALLGSFDWDSLVTRQVGHYESGAFDIRGGKPRPTAVARMLQQLAAGDHPAHPAAPGAGWWRRPTRYHPGRRSALRPGAAASLTAADASGRPPLLISGASGTLGRAFARICTERNLAFKLVSRAEMDITDPAAVERALERYQPWALINASGYVRVDDAEHDAERCFRENAQGPQVLARACARHRIHLTTFSSDLVFDGRAGQPYVETDPISPINVYGRSKADGEQAVLGLLSDALVIRTSSFFGPWDQYNFVHHALAALQSGQAFAAPGDLIITPTYVPDLVDTCLNLVVDGECGIWHLTNGDAVSWIALARMAAVQAGLDPAALREQHSSDCNYFARRPANSALHSNRAMLLPPLDDALIRFVAQRC